MLCSKLLHFILLVFYQKCYAKNIFNASYDSIKTEVVKLLRMKYSLEIINKDQLDLKKEY